jgi:tetratricopeptide (TPR) repeat protein
MSEQHDKMREDFQRLLKTQNFKSEEEVNEFLSKISEHPIPSFPEEALSDIEKAEDLVYEAAELPPVKARKLIAGALQLDRNCISAYEFLSLMEFSPVISLVFLEKAIAIGRELFLGENAEEFEGHFWGIHETRPFMRCLQHYAECHQDMGLINEAILTYEEMLELNPVDNQGVRDFLLLALIEIGDDQKFEKYNKQYIEDDMTFSLFTRALFAFKTKGDTKASRQKLEEAMQANQFVIPKMLSKKGQFKLPDYYELGSEEEADFYANSAKAIWQGISGAMKWLKKNGEISLF